MAEQSEDELAATSSPGNNPTPSSSTTISTPTPTLTPQEESARLQCGEKLKLGIVAFKDAYNLARKETTKAAITDLLDSAMAILQGRPCIPFTSLQGITEDLKDIRRTLS